MASEHSMLHAADHTPREVLNSAVDCLYKRNLLTDSYEYLTPAIERLSGYTAEAFMQLPTEAVLARIHPDDLADVATAIEACRCGPGGCVCTAVYRFLHADGEYRWFEDRFTVRVSRDGKRRARFGTVRDITTQKANELALAEARELLDEVHRLARIGVFRAVRSTGAMTWSEVLYDIAGRDPSQPLPSYDGVATLCTPSSWTRLDEAVRRATQTGSACRVEVELVRPDGTRCWTDCNIAPVFDGAGTVTEYRGTVQDIDERKRAQDALAATESIRLAFNATAESILLLDREARLLAINSVCAQRLGMEVDDVIGQQPVDWLPPAISAHWRARLDQVFATGEFATFIDDTGSQTVSHDLYPAHGTDGQVSRVAAYTR